MMAGCVHVLVALLAAVFLAIQVQVYAEVSLSGYWFGWWSAEEPKLPLRVTVSDIGATWVHLTWDEGGGDVKCDDEPFFPVSNSTLHCNCTSDDKGPWELSIEYSYNITSANILDLATNATCSCWVEVQSEASPSCCQRSPQLTFTPGDGNVTGVHGNHVIIANFTDELESCTTLNCTVTYKGIQTDTVWTIDKYKGKAVEHEDIGSFRGFKLYGEKHEASEDSCENLMDISGEAMKDLNGTTLYCGSHVNHYQAKSDFHICEVPPQLIKESDFIIVREGTTNYTIRVTHSNLKASDITWSKDGMDISKDIPKINFETITFNEIRKEDAGTYVDKFNLTCFERVRQFNFSFTLKVSNGPTVQESRKKYSVCEGGSITLICETDLTSSPESNITWNHFQAESDTDRYVKTEEPNVALTINNVTRSDGGIWSCINLLMGILLVEIELTVVVPPSEPLDVSVVAVNESNVVVSWNLPMDSGSPSLAGYKLCFNGICDMDVEGEIAEVSVAHFKQNGYLCYSVTVCAISKSEDVSMVGPQSERVWIILDHPQHLTVADIGYDWVYLTWSRLTLTCGQPLWEYDITCSSKSHSFTITTPSTACNITSLLSSAIYECVVVAILTEDKASSISTPPVSFTPGAVVVGEDMLKGSYIIISVLIVFVVILVLVCAIILHVKIGKPGKPKADHE